MPSGHTVNGLDLDDIFDLYVQGTMPGLTGYTVAGVDIRERYAPLAYGSQAAVTGKTVAGVGDLNTLFAKKGTASYSIPGLQGAFFQAGDSALTNQQSVNASVSVTLKTDGTWVASGGNSHGTIFVQNGTWLPAGSVPTDFEVKIEATKTGYTDATLTNGATVYSQFNINRGVSLSLPNYPGNNSHDHDANASVTIRLRRIGSTVESVTTFSMHVNTNGYV